MSFSNSQSLLCLPTNGFSISISCSWLQAEWDMVSSKTMGWERRTLITIYNSTRWFFQSVLFLKYEGMKGSGVQWGTSGIRQAAKLEDAFLFFLFFYPFLQNYMKDNFNVWEMIRESSGNVLRPFTRFFHSLTAPTQKKSQVLKYQWTSWSRSLS